MLAREWNNIITIVVVSITLLKQTTRSGRLKEHHKRRPIFSVSSSKSITGSIGSSEFAYDLIAYAPYYTRHFLIF